MGMPPAVLTGLWQCENPDCPLDGDLHDVLITGQAEHVLMLAQEVFGCGHNELQSEVTTEHPYFVFSKENGTYLVMRPAHDAAEMLAALMTRHMGHGHDS